MFKLNDAILCHVRKDCISHHGNYQNMILNLYHITFKSIRLLKIIGCCSLALNFALYTLSNILYFYLPVWYILFEPKKILYMHHHIHVHKRNRKCSDITFST